MGEETYGSQSLVGFFYQTIYETHPLVIGTKLIDGGVDIVL